MSKPKFCSSCGAGVGVGAVSPPSPRRGTVRPSPQRAEASRVDDSEGTDIHFVPQIGKLEYEVDGDYSSISSRKIPLSSVIGTNPSPDSSPPLVEEISPEPPGESTAVPPVALEEKAKAVKQTMEECKSSASNVVDVGEE